MGKVLTMPSWVQWEGGNKPFKGAPPMKVRYRCGQEVEYPDCTGLRFRWNHTGHSHDIVSYKFLRRETA